MTENVEQNKLRRYMIFEINLEVIKEPTHFSRNLVDFFKGINLTSAVYNVRNEIYIAYLSKKEEVKINSIREFFGSAFTKIYWFDKKNPQHDFTIIKKKKTDL